MPPGTLPAGVQPARIPDAPEAYILTIMDVMNAVASSNLDIGSENTVSLKK
ncbi:MAG TPA: hypothetical protein VFB86_00620 [Bacteroidales bacterium]|nr:hypothetical protein [Bacteroidales bacterium]